MSTKKPPRVKRINAYTDATETRVLLLVDDKIVELRLSDAVFLHARLAQAMDRAAMGQALETGVSHALKD